MMLEDNGPGKLRNRYDRRKKQEAKGEKKMNIEDFIPQGEQKMRIVQELVPGKQVTLAHVIASPDPIIYRKLGLDPKLDYNRAAIGILSLSPAEISVMKKANIDMGFIDRFSGTLLFTGKVAEVENAIIEINQYLKEKLGFTLIMVTHNQNIADMARTIIRVNSGKITEVVTNDQPQTAYEIGW